MNQERLIRQALILRSKKNNNKPVSSVNPVNVTVQDGVIKIDQPIERPSAPRSYRTPSPPAQMSKPPSTPKPPVVKPDKVSPKKTTKCSTCSRRRKSG